MVKLRKKNYWVPTKVAGERIFWMILECNLNMPSGNGGPSIAEIVWACGDPAEGLHRLPDTVPGSTRDEARKLLQPWPEGRYTLAYQRSGGLLNLFTPSWGEQEDEVWAAMVDEWERQSFPDPEARREARQALEQAWNNEPHPFFAGLSPAQVMIGGGEREYELVDDFLRKLSAEFEGERFESQGESLVQTLLFLRSWENVPHGEDQTPREIIIAERNTLLERRERILQQREMPVQGDS
jgi:hypothetical protein